MRAGDRSGAKFLIVCSTPLSKSEMSLEVIGVVAPLARVATTLRALEASDVGCARRPAWANSVAARDAAQSDKTRARHPASDRLTLIFRMLPCMLVQSQRLLNPILFSLPHSSPAWFFRLSASALAQTFAFPLFRCHCPFARSLSHTNLRLSLGARSGKTGSPN